MSVVRMPNPTHTLPATRAFPRQRIRQELSRMASEVEFVRVELNFLEGITLQAKSISIGLKDRLLGELWEDLYELQILQLDPLELQIDSLLNRLSAFEEEDLSAESAQDCLRRFQSLKAALADWQKSYRALKCQAFDLIDDFLVLRIV